MTPTPTCSTSNPHRPGVINTMPQATLDAFADHGATAVTLGREPDEWSAPLKELGRRRIAG